MRFAENPSAPVFVAGAFTRDGVQYPDGWLASAWANGEHALVQSLGIGPVTEDPDAAPDGQVLEAEDLLHNGELGFYVVNTYSAPPLADLLAQVNADRDARIDGGFLHTVDSVQYTFQSKPSDRENVMGMAMAAGAAMAAMAAADPPVNPVGNLRWFNPAVDFNWITADNTLCPMDAPQTQGLFAAGAGFKAACTFTARAAKDAMIADGTDAGAQAIYNAITWPT